MVYKPDHRAQLELSNLHIRQGEAHIVRQEQIVQELRRAGYPTLVAEDLLLVFRDTMKSHQDHRALILREIEHEKALATGKRI